MQRHNEPITSNVADVLNYGITFYDIRWKLSLSLEQN